MRVFFFVFMSLAWLSCSGCGDTSGGKTIIVYSPHGKYLEGDIKQRFEAQHPGWTVQFLDMGGGEILDRVLAEKGAPRASVWWGGSAGDFKRAEAAGVLEPLVPEFAKALPENAKSPTGGWVATFLTPEIIMYDPRKVKREEVPHDWDGLLDPKWKGKIAIRDVRRSSTMKTIFGAVIQREQKRTGSIDKGFEWLKKLDANTGAYAASPEALAGLLEGGGPYALTPWNLADVLEGRRHRNQAFEYVIPDETIVPVEPVALLKGGPNPEGARMFYDFVNSPEQLLAMAAERDRIPARTDLPKEKLPEWMRGLKLKQMDVNWDEIDANIEEWMVRWDAEVKGQGKR